MRNRPAWQLLLVLGLVSCGDCSGGGGGSGGGSGGSGGSGGGSSSSSFSYTLTEAAGEWSLTGSTDPSLNCVSTTTSSKRSLVFGSPIAKAATFVPAAGFFTSLSRLSMTVGKIEGTRTCTTGNPGACPTFPVAARTDPLFLIISATKTLPPNPANGVAFIPELSVTLPQFCESGVWDVAKAPLRGRPITVSELKSGRFVVEGSGTVNVTEQAPDIGDSTSSPLTGKLTYAFRLVFQADDYNPANAVVPAQLVTYEECTHDMTPTTADLDAARAAYAAAGTDIPLNANGCRRMKVTRTATGETRKHELTRGTLLTYDSATDTTTASRDAVVTYENESDATGTRERYDSDHDGIFEATGETRQEAGEWKWSTVRELSPTNTVELQTTRTRIDATTMTVAVEENGVAVDSFVAPIRQRGCFDSSTPAAARCAQPPPPTTCTGTTAKCDATQLAKLNPRITAALKKGKECLQKHDLKGYDPTGKGVDLSMGKIDLSCSTNACDPYGFLDGPVDGRHNLMVNVAKNSDSELARTIFHEMLHTDPRFSHSDWLVNAAGKACKQQLADRTYACEQLCFAKTPTSCDCIRCLTPDGKKPTKAVCQKCAAYGACAGRQEPNGTGGMRAVASTVGAVCKTGIFCDTKAECDSSCGMLGPCKSIKATCNDSCN